MKEKMHKLDVIFWIGILIIGSITAMIDGFRSIPFPVYTCASIYISYGLWIILLIYSSFKYTKKDDRPKYVRGSMFFVLPFLHITFAILGFILCGILKYIFDL